MKRLASARQVPLTAPRAPAPTRRVVVIGAGLAGLAAAIELAGAGMAVTIVERHTHVGGKMNVLEEGGYAFDMGPTIITLPQVLRGIFRRAGRDPRDYVRLVNLDPQWRCHYEDGAVIDLRADPGATAAALDAQFPGRRAGEGFLSFLAYARRMLGLSERVFFYRDLGGVADLARRPPKDKGLLADVLAMRPHSTVAATIHKHVREPHVAQLCEHFLQYVGSSPMLAPAILSLIAAAQADHGCWYAFEPGSAPGQERGGTRCVAGALERLARALGVTIITGVGVRRVQVSGERASGVQLDDGRTILCDAVVSNADVQRTCRDLVGNSLAFGEQRRIARAYSPACSGLVLYLGLDRRYEHLAHHNFLFSRDSRQEFDDIYRLGIPARDPTIYLCAPSRTDPSRAPQGAEALYALVHTPFLRPGQQWESAPGRGLAGEGGSAPREVLRAYRPIVMDKLARFGMPDLERRIRVERFLTPQSIERLYSCEGGAIYGLASHGRLRGGFKPRNTSPVLSNLFLAGGSVNPGPGVPMVLMGGVTAARSLLSWAGVACPPIEPGEGFEPESKTHPGVRAPGFVEDRPGARVAHA